MATADRSFSAATVPPGRQVTVTISPAGYGDAGQVTETLPPGFAYVSSSLSGGQVTVTGQVVQEVTFTLTGETSFTYTVTAPSIESLYTFSGTVKDSQGNDYPVGGDDRMTVSLRDWLLILYDANDNGMFDRAEVIAAINDYQTGQEGITRSDLIQLINLYLSGPN